MEFPPGVFIFVNCFPQQVHAVKEVKDVELDDEFGGVVWSGQGAIKEVGRFGFGEACYADFCSCVRKFVRCAERGVE